MFIASYGLVTAKHNSSIGAVCAPGSQHDEAKHIMLEAKAIADALGVGLPSDIIVKIFEKAATFPSSTPTSLQLDVNSGKGLNELELFAGTIIKLGVELEIQTAYTERLYKEFCPCRNVNDSVEFF